MEKVNASVKIVGLRIEPKPERKRHEDWDAYEKSSDIRAFNIYEQDWSTIVALGMEELFSDEAEFIARKQDKRKYERKLVNNAEERRSEAEST